MPVPKSKTLLPSFISFAKSDNSTLSIPKQNPSVFCIIFNPLYSRSSILSFSFNIFPFSISFLFFLTYYIINFVKKQSKGFFMDNNLIYNRNDNRGDKKPPSKKLDFKCCKDNTIKSLMMCSFFE